MEPKDWPQPQQQLFLLSVQFASAMSVAASLIQKLAESHGGRPGEWLDRLEEEIVRDFKNSEFSTGTSMQQEVFAMEPQLKVVRDIFNLARHNLTKTG